MRDAVKQGSGRAGKPATLFTWEKIMAGKKYREAASQVDQTKAYSIDEAVELAKKVAFAKFDETVELAMTLGVDPRKADQNDVATVAISLSP